MRDARLLADDNRLILEGGVGLIQQLDDRLFVGDPQGNSQGNSPGESEGKAWDGVGKQFRHLIDFYESLLNGLESGRIDYVHRTRDPRLETSRDFSSARLRSVVERLGAIAELDADAEVRVKAERTVNQDGDEIWSRSSVARELQFLMSHTIHHYALIKALLATQGFEAPADFGVAPSTLQHWRETTTVTR